MRIGKTLLVICVGFLSLAGLAACAVNPATGQQQFTALMPASQEFSIGAQEHEKVVAMYGALSPGDPLQAYVDRIGRRLVPHTERGDVTYKFTVLDTPMLNAFALPGGFVYITRGILAQANSESEVAAVMAHEIGHITARHSAERYSQGVLASLGAAAIAIAADNPDAGRLAGLGSDLYMKSYSRGQEHQADDLGIRYVSRAGYDSRGMANFLRTLGANADLERAEAGQRGENPLNTYFSTHPRTQDRVAQAEAIAASYVVEKPMVGRDEHLGRIDGMLIGDSPRQGFVRDGAFWHPDMGFTFDVPRGFKIENQPRQIVAVDRGSGAVMIFDAAPNKGGLEAASYISGVWMKGKPAQDLERLTINGMRAATASFPGSVNNRPVNIRLVAVEWAPDRFYRYQIAIPSGAGSGIVDELKRSTYSLRRMTAQEKSAVQPHRLRVITAKAGDSVASLAARFPEETLREQRFRVLNGLGPSDEVVSGKRYKIIND